MRSTPALAALIAFQQDCLAASCFRGMASSANAQPFDSRLFGEMRSRGIGPYRGGRTKTAVGIPWQPNVFYIAMAAFGKRLRAQHADVNGPIR